MRILVTGSRTWTDYTMIRNLLANIDRNKPGPHTLVHGGARGADTLAAEIADELGWVVEGYPVTKADWDAYPRTAGFIRNQKMVNLGADLCLAFFETNSTTGGTLDCMKRARMAEIPVAKFYT